VADYWGQVSGAVQQRAAHAASHILLAPRDARRADARDSKLAGHSNLTTQRYMHLSPAALDSAIRLIDRPESEQFRGDMLKTGDFENAKSNI
jgi:hypothetical protein